MLSVAPYVIDLVPVDARGSSSTVQLGSAAPWSAMRSGSGGSSSSKPEYKLGIYVGLGGNPNPMLYEFDTGGGGFWAAYTTQPILNQWWGKTQVVGRKSLSITYSSGNRYVANKVATTVDLYQRDDSGGFTKVVGTGQPVDMGRIVRFSNVRNAATIAAWNYDLKWGLPPLENNFYGDFGVSLSPEGTNGANSLSRSSRGSPCPPGSWSASPSTSGRSAPATPTPTSRWA